jgi:hypothetical protein
MFAGMFVILSISTPFLFAQTTDQWPKPSVALYDCNSSAAIADSAGQNIINSSSRLILQDILNDTSSREVFLFSYGCADTTATDFTSLGESFPLPDSGGAVDADYVISSKLVGNAGSYTLTVSIEDGHTFAHVVDGTAIFSSVTDDNVKSACLTAVQKILPLTTEIRSYQESLKKANPLLSINPQIDLSPAQLKLSLKGSTNVTITAIDCDGAPMANRQLSLEATGGSFGSSTAQTDNYGVATAVFTASESDGIAILTATIQNSISVTFDTTDPSGSEAVVVGNVDTTTLWVMEFDFKRSWTICSDSLAQAGDGTSWQQKTFFLIQSARGKFFGIEGDKDPTDIEFADSTLSLSRGIYFEHQFLKYSHSGSTCEGKYWEIQGSSANYIAKADSNHQGSVGFEYQPEYNTQLFEIEIPYATVNLDGYDWRLENETVNGVCQARSTFDDYRSKPKSFSPGGDIWSGGEGSALSIMPSYSGSSISGWTITADSTATWYDSDGGFNVTIDQCTATVRPFSTVTEVKETGQPKQFFLSQNYPNPFNPTTVICYQLPKSCRVTLKVYDILGREVVTLVDEQKTAGEYKVTFDGSRFASGVYFYKLVASPVEPMTAGNYISVKKLVLMK